jgi:hypothetical protein
MARRVKVCAWNIQNYGAGNPAFKWGAASDLRNRFIADFANANDIDVLLVQEVSVRADASLRDLVRRMNRVMPAGHWAGSFAGSALTKYASSPPLSRNETTFGTDARYEGYAVLWRTREARFRLVGAVNDIAQMVDGAAASPINLSTKGRPAGYVRGLSWGATGGYLIAERFPYDDRNRLMDHWPDLELPTTSVRNADRLKLYRTRRPAYVVLELLDGPPEPGRRLVPVGVYHAPSSTEGSELGAMLSALARELYVSNTLLPSRRIDPRNYVGVSKAVMAGDYNYSVRSGPDWPGFYGNYTHRQKIGPNGGAECEAGPDPRRTDRERSTVVQLSDDEGDPIVSRRIDAYLTSMIDLGFFSLSCDGDRANVPADLLGPVTPYRATIQALETHLRAEVRALRGRWYQVSATGPERRVWDPRQGRYVWSPMISGSYGATFVDWVEFMRQARAGVITEARQACELYRLFISDHLPVIVNVVYTRG